jgi:hypothetical protein
MVVIGVALEIGLGYSFLVGLHLVINKIRVDGLAHHLQKGGQ